MQCFVYLHTATTKGYFATSMIGSVGDGCVLNEFAMAPSPCVHWPEWGVHTSPSVAVPYQTLLLKKSAEILQGVHEESHCVQDCEAHEASACECPHSSVVSSVEEVPKLVPEIAVVVRWIALRNRASGLEQKQLVG